MIKGACPIEENHAADKYAHGKNDNRIIRVYCFANQWEAQITAPIIAIKCVMALPGSLNFLFVLFIMITPVIEYAFLEFFLQKRIQKDSENT